MIYNGNKFSTIGYPQIYEKGYKPHIGGQRLTLYSNTREFYVDGTNQAVKELARVLDEIGAQGKRKMGNFHTEDPSSSDEQQRNSNWELMVKREINEFVDSWPRLDKQICVNLSGFVKWL